MVDLERLLRAINPPDGEIGCEPAIQGFETREYGGRAEPKAEQAPLCPSCKQACGTRRLIIRAPRETPTTTWVELETFRTKFRSARRFWATAMSCWPVVRAAKYHRITH
jgi:hypothetical protein